MAEEAAGFFVELTGLYTASCASALGNVPSWRKKLLDDLRDLSIGSDRRENRRRMQHAGFGLDPKIPREFANNSCIL